MGDPALLPPPLPPYESPSERRRAVRESRRVMRRAGKIGLYSAGEDVAKGRDEGFVGFWFEPWWPDRRQRPIGTKAPRDGDIVPVQPEKARATPRPVGLLMAPPVGGGEQGGLVERPAHPKPTCGAVAAPLPRRRALLDTDMVLEGDGNWDDGNVAEEMEFRRGAEAQIGGIVDMEDDVYMEFEEDEEVKAEPVEKTAWNLLARYMASFKPNTKAMFTRFTDEDLDEAAQPSETVLDSVPVWVRIYAVPWGKQDDVWGRRYGNGLGKALEVDVPASEQDKKEFLRVRVNLPYNRRLQTQITTGVKGKP
ncbi:hypothetical protein ACQ4PT_063820 [Festuca glaucescens]